MIKAPYNFVPLSDKVYFPEWADAVSQDVPFEDGLSGTIRIKINPKTPIFVRNGHAFNEEIDENIPLSFSHTEDGEYFLPATALKGSIRNVLEIITFSKMQNISDKRYSVRDLSSAQNKFMKFFQMNDVHCGWMTKACETITITDNGTPWRIAVTDIDERLGTRIYDRITNGTFLKNDSNRTAMRKYELAQGCDLTGTFAEWKYFKSNPEDKRKFAVYSDKGESGTIVFTGQPSIRKERREKKKASGKFFEFVFRDKVVASYQIQQYEEGGVFEDFEFIYKNSEDWAYWKSCMENGQKVPVFFTTQNGKIQYLGLSYLFKLPYSKRIKGYLYDDHNNSRLDMAECIFGNVSNPLRGRVQFSHAKCIKHIEGERVTVYQNSPKPTFYPIYIRQPQGTNGYMVHNEKLVPFKTMLDDDARLRGWKRYPVRTELADAQIPEGQDENTTTFVPLCEGTEFLCDIRVHNLKPQELGALLRALELKKDCSHSLGYAKPFGYGCCDILVNDIQLTPNSSVVVIKSKEEYIKMFEEHIAQKIHDYAQSPQIREFYAMTRTAYAEHLKSPLQYMELSEFVDVKKQNAQKQIYGEYQEDYTQLLKKVEQKPSELPKMTATIIVMQGQLKQARLTEGKDTDKKELIVSPSCKDKLRVGDNIWVKPVTNKNGKIIKLEYKSKA